MIHGATEIAVTLSDGRRFPNAEVIATDEDFDLAVVKIPGNNLIAAEWGQSENNRRAKFYTLTTTGRRRLRDETAGWNRLATAIAAALNTTSEEV